MTTEEDHHDLTDYQILTCVIDDIYDYLNDNARSDTDVKAIIAAGRTCMQKLTTMDKRDCFVLPDDLLVCKAIVVALSMNEWSTDEGSSDLSDLSRAIHGDIHFRIKNFTHEVKARIHNAIMPFARTINNEYLYSLITLFEATYFTIDQLRDGWDATKVPPDSDAHKALRQHVETLSDCYHWVDHVKEMLLVKYNENNPTYSNTNEYIGKLNACWHRSTSDMR